MLDLSLHMLDICENCLDAGAKSILIRLEEDLVKNRLSLTIKDDGEGMEKKQITRVLDPFYTTKKTKRVGLGVPLLAQAAKEAGGKIDIKSKKGEGTTLRADFVYDHIDRKPLGDIPQTLINIIASRNSEFDIIYRHRKSGREFCFNTRQIKKELKDISINDPQVLLFLKNEINKGLKEIEKGGL